MNVIVDLSLIPLGVGVSLSPFVAACERELEQSGLVFQLHANGTNIEGEWEAVMATVKRCHETVHALGAPRIATNLRIGTRTDRPQSMQDKLDSVARELARDSGFPVSGGS